jgi:hypothetical protein
VGNLVLLAALLALAMATGRLRPRHGDPR